MKQILSLIVFTLFLSYSCFAQPSAPKKEKKGYKIGSTVSDFKMKHIDGKTYDLASIDDANGYIVIFTSNVCPFAVAYEDRMIALHNKMAPKGYPIIAINSNERSEDSFDAMITKSNEKSFPFLYLKDQSEEYLKFGANKTPHVFLLDKDMKVRYIGAIDDNPDVPAEVTTNYVENAIIALQNGQTPNPETTKAIGCPIKAKGIKGKKGGKGERRGPPSPDKLMEKMDKNNDQKISKEEVDGRLAKDFDRLDENNDGFLTLEELSKLKKKKKKK